MEVGLWGKDPPIQWYLLCLSQDFVFYHWRSCFLSDTEDIMVNLALVELQEFWFCLYFGLCVNLWISWISNKKCCVKSATVPLFFPHISNCNCCASSSAEKGVTAAFMYQGKNVFALVFLAVKKFFLPFIPSTTNSETQYILSRMAFLLFLECLRVFSEEQSNQIRCLKFVVFLKSVWTVASGHVIV